MKAGDCEQFWRVTVVLHFLGPVDVAAAAMRVEHANARNYVKEASSRLPIDK